MDVVNFLSIITLDSFERIKAPLGINSWGSVLLEFHQLYLSSYVSLDSLESICLLRTFINTLLFYRLGIDNTSQRVVDALLGPHFQLLMQLFDMFLVLVALNNILNFVLKDLLWLLISHVPQTSSETMLVLGIRLINFSHQLFHHIYFLIAHGFLFRLRLYRYFTLEALIKFSCFLMIILLNLYLFYLLESTALVIVLSFCCLCPNIVS